MNTVPSVDMYCEELSQAEFCRNILRGVRGPLYSTDDKTNLITASSQYRLLVSNRNYVFEQSWTKKFQLHTILMYHFQNMTDFVSNASYGVKNNEQTSQVR